MERKLADGMCPCAHTIVLLIKKQSGPLPFEFGLCNETNSNQEGAADGRTHITSTEMALHTRVCPLGLLDWEHQESLG